MDETTLPSATNAQVISSDDVLKAYELSRQGEQRLRPIVDGQLNAFLFDVSLDDGRWASVNFRISPITSELARHMVYVVTGCFTPSDDTVQSSQVHDLAQKVYDTYIQVVRLRLSHDLYCYQRQTFSRPIY